MRDRLKRLAAVLRLVAAVFGPRELFLFGGLASLAYGVAQVYPPAAWMVVGLVLMLMALRRRGAE